MNARSKKQWLNDKIGYLIKQESDNKGAPVFSVPHLYRTAQYVPSVRGTFTRHASAERQRLCVVPVEIHASSAEDAYGMLFDLMCNVVGNGGEFSLYIPKEGQPIDVIDLEKTYAEIKNNDPEHVHGSPKLIDFSIIYNVAPLISSEKVALAVGSLEGRHAHFLLEK